MIATTILARVDNDRLQRGVEGLTAGAYTITLATQTEAEIRGFVANGDGTEYGVVLSEGHAFCSCKDAMYRKGVCKHSVALALYTIRTPKMEVKREAPVEATLPPITLPKLAKVRHWA
jgi:uncharacterized Zn finger protein